MSASAFRLAAGRFEPWRRFLVAPAWHGTMAPAMLVAATLLASIFATQYSHIDDSICQLGAQDRPQAWIMSLGFVAYAVFVVAFSLQIRRSLDSGWGRAASKALLVHAAYALLLAFVQANPRISGIEHNAEGAVHIFLARGAMLLIGGLAPSG